MDPQQQVQHLLLEALLCEEECVVVEEEEEESERNSLSSFMMSKSDLCWEEDEVLSLLTKEKQTHVGLSCLNSDVSLMLAREDALVWFLSVKSQFGFSCLTVVLALNYFDRFSSSFVFQKDNKAWMTQLTAVACLSLAAKVEETHLPLLVDLQVEEFKFVFEARTIQRMELLVLSTLGWKMNPVTPNSFFDFMIRRLGLNLHLLTEFLWRCERLLLSVIADSRFLVFLPSIVAASVMLYVINEIEAFDTLDYQNQVLSVLKVNQATLSECYKLIMLLSSNNMQSQGHKRKDSVIPSSPSGVVDISFSFDTLK